MAQTLPLTLLIFITALVLNLFWPFAVLSIPFGFLGGKLILPASAYRIILGAVQFFAAWRLAFAALDRQCIGNSETAQ